MLGAVVELVGREGLAGLRRGVVHELVALAARHLARLGHPLAPRRLPLLAAVARALDDLPEPGARLGSVQPVRVGRRSLEVVDLPAREVGPADLPLVALPVRRHDERALARADQY